MSNVSYDLDTSGGLMPLIRALIKPPDEDLNTQKPKKPQHPYYKRPGKGHNHDSCDACGEGGDLICCDRCPASFHLGCYDPPLDENDIPAGQWLCRECRAADAQRPPSARGSRAASPSGDDKKTRSLRNRANSTKKRSKDDDDEDRTSSEGAGPTSAAGPASGAGPAQGAGPASGAGSAEGSEPSPMEVLVRAARIMNPRQFELPREMQIFPEFPGTDKEGTKTGTTSLVTVDAWGCVPIPAKLCFACQLTCKHAPLLQCDYCPLLFHQDCLDPPLTALPTGRWMCPNHVEQYIDWKLVNSISATERVALWSQFAAPVDQHAIKIDFIRRARNNAPSFRVKVPVGIKGRVVVPEMVRYHYRRPPPLLPSRREYVRCARVLKTLREDKNYDTTTEEDEEAPKHKICLDLSCGQHPGDACALLPAAASDAQDDLSAIDDMSAKYSVEHKICLELSCALLPAAASDARDDLSAIDDMSAKMEKHSDSSSDLSDSDFEYFTASVKRRRVTRSPPTDTVRLREGGDVRQLLACVDEQLHKLDERLVRLLAWQRLQQVSFGEASHGPWSNTPVGARVGGAVRRALAGARLAARGAALPSALLTAADRRRIAAAVWGRPPPPVRQEPKPEMADAAVRATLTATSPTHNGDIVGAPIAMRRACITIGTDSGCDVRLSPACTQVSPHHATIFMDEVTRHFELINYSEWGCVVNGVLYACDLAPREPPADAPALPTRAPPAPRITGPLTSGGPDVPPCRCSPRAAQAAWEGSALVPHGALLAFGCQAFVFSITDYLAYPYEDYPDEPAL